MNRILLVLLLTGLVSLSGLAQTVPSAEDFRVLQNEPAPGPHITRYLQYQADQAWKEDALRQKNLENIHSEKEFLDWQKETREKLLKMIGGLPEEKTPLNPQITGRIQMNGFHIEKLIFESLPKVYVTALVYVPDDGQTKHPAVLVSCGHADNGKIHYQALSQRLVQNGYIVICWDPVGQSERSQFWDATNNRSRYNLICAEHAVMGNLAFLAGASLARWEIWDGIRAVDYLLTRVDVDTNRISITGTSGGGFQAAHIAALDERIKVAVPSCYITTLAMRVYNRMFVDPDSDPEQDLDGMIGNVDHAGLLLLMYPRPVMVAAAVLDFFPIEGTHQSMREAAGIYARFGRPENIGIAESYNEHMFSDENQLAAIKFLNKFNRVPIRQALPEVKELDPKVLQCTRTGQIVTDYPQSRRLPEVIREYFVNHQSKSTLNVSSLYYGKNYPGIKNWPVTKYEGLPVTGKIAWEMTGTSQSGDITIEKYLIHHSSNLQIPLLRFYSKDKRNASTIFRLNETGKARSADWAEISKLVQAGFDVISFDFRGTGEDRMNYKVVSADAERLPKMDWGNSDNNPLSSVMADYVYNSVLTGRPYFLQMIEDTEIVKQFAETALKANEIKITANDPDTKMLAREIGRTLPSLKPLHPDNIDGPRWSEIVNEKRELWAIQNLLPNGAYIH